MIFNLVVATASESDSDKAKFFESACRKNEVDFNLISADDFDFINAKPLEGGNLLYRSSLSSRARVCERLLASDTCATFYRSWKNIYNARGDSFFGHKLAGLPVIPSYPLLPASREELKKAAQYVGGYPLILKALGGSKGIGVMKVESEESLRSIVDFFAKDAKARFSLRKFIPHQSYGRLIVVGDEVVASNRTYVPEGDFRSNTSDNVDDNRKPFVFSPELQAVAVQAAHESGIDFAGIDLLFDDDGSTYIAEANFPCEFEAAQKITGIDVADHMIQYLMRKAENLSTTE